MTNGRDVRTTNNTDELQIYYIGTYIYRTFIVQVVFLFIPTTLVHFLSLLIADIPIILSHKFFNALKWVYAKAWGIYLLDFSFP